MNNFVETPRGRFAYKVRGNPDGPTLLFVAGLGDGLDSWDVVLDGFSDYRCVTFDNRGIGGSIITDGDYTVQEMAEDTHALAEALNLQGCLAIGSSMGGAICQEWALKYPADVAALVLTNTWGKSDGYLRLLFESWKGLASDNQRNALVDALILFCFSPETVNATPAIADEFRVVVSSIDMNGFQGAAAACRDHSALDRLQGLRLPTLIVAATQDILTNPRHSEALAERINGAELKYVEGGHMVFGDNPKGWLRVVKPWIDLQNEKFG
jgi:3-oxoadipate enol-lactonase